MLMKSLLLVVVAASGCAFEGENGESCVFPFTSVDCGGGGSGGDVTRVDFTNGDQLADDPDYNARAAANGVIELALHSFNLREFQVTTTSPGASVTRLDTDRLLVSTGTGNPVRLEVEGTTELDEPFADVFDLWTGPASDVAIAPFTIDRVGCFSDCYTLLGSDVAYHVDAARTIVQLSDASTASRLIDVSLSLGTGTSEHVTQISWDQIQLPTVAGDYHVTLTADSFGERSFDVTVVDNVDRLTAEWLPIVPTYGGGREVCFHAHSLEREVFAPSWTFHSDSSIVIRNCVWIYKPGTVTAEAFGRTLDFVAEADALPTPPR